MLSPFSSWSLSAKWVTSYINNNISQTRPGPQPNLQFTFEVDSGS